LHHRHNGPPIGGLFAIGAAVGDQLVGVVIVGRPVGRNYDNGTTVELSRCATDGTPNVGSMLYASAWRAAKALGYRRLITYTLATEPGSSLHAAGWHIIAERPARAGWHTMSRPRTANPWTDTVPKTLWEA
jgi:hypothetical protein